MDRQRDTEALVSAILNEAWMVRHYALQRTPSQRLHREQAIQKLGCTVRDAFCSSEDFEPLLAAILDGLRPDQVKKPF